MNATATTSSTNPKSGGTTVKESDELPEVKAVTNAEIKNAAEIDYAQQLVPLNTSEDALMAFLQGKIDEDVLLQVVSRYGQVHEQWMLNGQLSAYDKEIPKGVLIRKDEVGDHKAFVEDVERKHQERLDAMKDSLKNLEEDEGSEKDVVLERRALERDIEIAEGNSSENKKK